MIKTNNASKIKPNYGIDAPDILKRYSLYGMIALSLSLGVGVYLSNGWIKWGAVFLTLLISGFLFFPVITILLGSLFFKFKARDLLLNQIAWTGSEAVLDVGCGSGLLLIGAAKRLVTGKATGLDLWKQEDQTGNSIHAALKNAQIERVEDRVTIYTADMREMPFALDSFDLVLSSWAVHNIYEAKGRIKALEEMIRVLRVGGQIAIIDIVNAHEYFSYFKERAMTDVRIEGPFFTFGTPSYLVLAKKASS